MRFLFVMDPLDRVTHDKDTTFAFIEAAQARGHTSYHALAKDLSVTAGQAHAGVHPVEILKEPPWIRLHHDQRANVRLDDLDAVFIRKDPPFDRTYLYLTLLLERARNGPLLVNDP